MELAIYLIVGLSITWATYLLYLWLAAKSMEGRMADELLDALPELAEHPERALVYCYSPSCGPCRAMSPVVDQLHDDGEPVFKVDIAANAELARDLGVRAAPTLLLVENGTISQVLLGSRNRPQLEALLNSA